MASDGKIVKMEQDFGPIVDSKIPQLEVSALNGKLAESMEEYYSLEKQTRVAGDAISTAKLLVSIVKVLYQMKDFSQLNEQIIMLSKRRGQLKEAIKRMVQEAVNYVDLIADKKEKLQLIGTLVTVTSGKIYVEIERARLTRKLAQIKEDEGDISAAAATMQELQVETFGSMDKGEKVDFILEQMRLCAAKKDYIRTQIISKKISKRFFDNNEHQELKLKFYQLMIEPSLFDKKHFEVCGFYWEIYNTPLVKDEEIKALDNLKQVIHFLIISPFNNEQSDLFYRVYSEKLLEKIPKYKEILEIFKTEEVTQWQTFEARFGKILKSSPSFDNSEAGIFRFDELRKRVMEHNLRVISKYYSRISIKRISQLVDLKESEVEEFLCKLVVEKTLYARIDRITGIVSFQSKMLPDDILNSWSHDIEELMRLVDKTTHLISKERMVHLIK
eukprot:Sdes_comp19672_c0_seq3m11532